MKIQTIPDIHGKTKWKTLLDMSCDKFIFLGDYVDDYWPTTDQQIIDNLFDVIEFKKANPEKVELLLGNHDLQYMFSYSSYGCSGYRSSYHPVLHTIFNDNKDLFKIAYQQDKYLWNHAGVSVNWYKQIFSKVKPFPDGNIADQINSVFDSSHRDIVTMVGRTRGGWSPHGGPLWADKSETCGVHFTALTGYHQIVGHSKVDKLVTKYNTDKSTSITFCDCWDKTDEIYILEI